MNVRRALIVTVVGVLASVAVAAPAVAQTDSSNAAPSTISPTSPANTGPAVNVLPDPGDYSIDPYGANSPTSGHPASAYSLTCSSGGKSLFGIPDDWNMWGQCQAISGLWTADTAITSISGQALDSVTSMSLLNKLGAIFVVPFANWLNVTLGTTSMLVLAVIIGLLAVLVAFNRGNGPGATLGLMIRFVLAIGLLWTIGRYPIGYINGEASLTRGFTTQPVIANNAANTSTIATTKVSKPSEMVNQMRVSLWERSEWGAPLTGRCAETADQLLTEKPGGWGGTSFDPALRMAKAGCKEQAIYSVTTNPVRLGQVGLSVVAHLLVVFALLINAAVLLYVQVAAALAFAATGPAAAISVFPKFGPKVLASWAKTVAFPIAFAIAYMLTLSTIATLTSIVGTDASIGNWLQDVLYIVIAVLSFTMFKHARHMAAGLLTRGTLAAAFTLNGGTSNSSARAGGSGHESHPALAFTGGFAAAELLDNARRPLTTGARAIGTTGRGAKHVARQPVRVWKHPQVQKQVKARRAAFKAGRQELRDQRATRRDEAAAFAQRIADGDIDAQAPRTDFVYAREIHLPALPTGPAWDAPSATQQVRAELDPIPGPGPGAALKAGKPVTPERDMGVRTVDADGNVDTITGRSHLPRRGTVTVGETGGAEWSPVQVGERPTSRIATPKFSRHQIQQEIRRGARDAGTAPRPARPVIDTNAADVTETSTGN